MFKIDWGKAKSIYDIDKFFCPNGGEHSFPSIWDRNHTEISVIINGDSFIERVQCMKCGLKAMHSTSNKHGELFTDEVIEIK